MDTLIGLVTAALLGVMIALAISGDDNSIHSAGSELMQNTIERQRDALAP